MNSRVAIGEHRDRDHLQLAGWFDIVWLSAENVRAGRTLMKIVSFMAAATVAVVMTLVGCGGGPGKTPETTVPPTMQEFSGTFTVTPDLTNPFMGMITAMITGISQDGTALTDPAALAGAFALYGGAEQTFEYTLTSALDMTTITLTGDLLTKLMLPEGMVTATRTRAGPPKMNPLAALDGTWMTTVEDPQTTTLTLEITYPDFTLTVDTTQPSS